MGIGEAVITVLSERGAPTPVAWTRLRAPQSLMAPAPAEALAAAVAASPLNAEYAQSIDRESAYERLAAQTRAAAVDREDAPRGAGPRAAEPERRAERAPSRERAEQQGPGIVTEVVKSSAFKSFLRSAGTVLGREITRSIFGTARRRCMTRSGVGLALAAVVLAGCTTGGGTGAAEGVAAGTTTSAGTARDPRRPGRRCPGVRPSPIWPRPGPRWRPGTTLAWPGR